jgi:hypothetical protein
MIRRPHAKRRHTANDNPERYRAKANLLTSVYQRISALRAMWGREGMTSGLASGRPPVVMVVILGTMTGTVRHQHSRAGRIGSFGPNRESNLTSLWLIFREHKQPG